MHCRCDGKSTASSKASNLHVFSHVLQPRLRLRLVVELEDKLTSGPSAAMLIALAPPLSRYGPQADMRRVILDNTHLTRGLGKVYVRARFVAIRKLLGIFWQECIVMPVETASGEDEIAFCPGWARPAQGFCAALLPSKGSVVGRFTAAARVRGVRGASSLNHD